MGRKRIVVDWGRVDKLAKAQCHGTEIADDLGISYDTLVTRCKEDHKTDFSEYLRSKKESGKANAKITFYENAFEKGDTGAQIFWTKQHLGWSDKIKQDITTKSTVLEIPDNGTTNPEDGPQPWDEQES